MTNEEIDGQEKPKRQSQSKNNIRSHRSEKRVPGHRSSVNIPRPHLCCHQETRQPTFVLWTREYSYIPTARYGIDDSVGYAGGAAICSLQQRPPADHSGEPHSSAPS